MEPNNILSFEDLVKKISNPELKKNQNKKTLENLIFKKETNLLLNNKPLILFGYLKVKIMDNNSYIFKVNFSDSDFKILLSLNNKPFFKKIFEDLKLNQEINLSEINNLFSQLNLLSSLKWITIKVDYSDLINTKSTEKNEDVLKKSKFNYWKDNVINKISNWDNIFKGISKEEHYPLFWIIEEENNNKIKDDKIFNYWIIWVSYKLIKDKESFNVSRIYNCIFLRHVIRPINKSFREDIYIINEKEKNLVLDYEYRATTSCISEKNLFRDIAYNFSEIKDEKISKILVERCINEYMNKKQDNKIKLYKVNEYRGKLYDFSYYFDENIDISKIKNHKLEINRLNIKNKINNRLINIAQEIYYKDFIT